jgi:release factor glutamine methyltransferase
MTQNSLFKIVALACAAYFNLACAAITDDSKAGQPYMTVPHPGKFKLEYFSPSKEFPSYLRATVDGREFLATDNVQIPSAQSLYLLTHWKIFEGETVLDIGTGSGVQAVFAADMASSVLATDISVEAVEVARLNIKRHGLSKKIEVRQGDLFAPVNKDEKFDVILFNIAYPYNEKNQGLWKVHERFFAEAGKHLKPGGRIYYQSGLIDNVPRIKSMVDKNAWNILSIRMDAALKVARSPVVYLIQRTNDLDFGP